MLVAVACAALSGGCDFKECETGVTRICDLDDPECEVAMQTCMNDGHWGSCQCVYGPDDCFAGDRRSCEEDELPSGCCSGFVECTIFSVWDECTCQDWCDASTVPDAVGDPSADPADAPEDPALDPEPGDGEDEPGTDAGDD